jgi:urease accessory protein
MVSLTMVRHPLDPLHAGETERVVPADRWTLARRRWRGTADDGREFGFEVEHPLRHGDVVARNDHAAYVIQQSPEPCLAVPLPAAAEAARLAWQIGNLHQPVQVTDDTLIAPDDPAVRTLFRQLNLAFTEAPHIFEPETGAAGHHHHHEHATHGK